MTKRLCIAVALLLACGAAPAQDPPRWYEVEVIVFAYRDAVSQDPRLYRDPGLPDTAAALDLFDAEEQSATDAPVPLLASRSRAAAPEDETLYPVDRLTGQRVYDEQLYMALPLERQFAPLASDELRLNAEWRRLERSGLYRPLLHVGWRQPLVERDVAIPVRLSAGPAVQTDVFSLQLLGSPRSRQLHQLDGVATLLLSRYVHLEFDMAYRERLLPAPADGSAPVRVYRLTERRRIRHPDRLHYFDHPQLGIIAQLRRWEFPVPAAGEETLDASELMDLGTLPDTPPADTPPAEPPPDD